MALEGTEHETTVDALRNILSENVSEAIFEQYQSIYMGIHSELQSIESNLKHIKDTVQKLKKQCSNTSNKQENKSLIDRIAELREKYTELNREKDSVNELMGEFRFMQNITTLDDLKKYILTQPSEWPNL